MSGMRMSNAQGRGQLGPAVAEYLAASGRATLDELVVAIGLGGLPHKRASISTHLNEFRFRPGEPGRSRHARYRLVGDTWVLIATPANEEAP